MPTMFQAFYCNFLSVVLLFSYRLAFLRPLYIDTSFCTIGPSSEIVIGSKELSVRPHILGNISIVRENTFDAAPQY